MAHCILTTSKEYQSLKSQVGIDERTLKAAISVWQEDNGLDSFPTIIDINSIMFNSVTTVFKEFDKLRHKYGHTLFNKTSEILEQIIPDKLVYNREKAGAAYFSRQNEIRINSEWYNRLNNDAKLEVLIEEFIHSATADVFHRYEYWGTEKQFGEKLTKQEIEFVETINELFEYSKAELLKQGKKWDVDNKYGFTNSREFIANIFNNYQAMNITLSKVKSRNIIKELTQAIKDYIKFILHMTSAEPINRTVLNDVIEVTLDYMLNHNKVDNNEFLQAEQPAIPLKGNEELYKHYNLLNEKGAIKNLSWAQAESWMKTLNGPTVPYRFKHRQTEGGLKILMYAKNTLFQTSNGGISPIQELEDTLTKFLNKLGVSVETIGEGDFVAKAKILEKIIQVVQGKADVSTLPEEASHFFVELLNKNSTLYKQMYDTIEQYQIYRDTYEEYKTLYLLEDGSVDVDKIKREAIAKLIGNHIVTLFKEGSTQPTDSWFKRAWNVITAAINKGLKSIGLSGFNQLINKAESKDSFVQSAEKILKGDISDISFNNLIEKQKNYEMLQKTNTTQQELVDTITASQTKIKVIPRKEGIENVHGYTIDNNGRTKEILITATTVSTKEAKQKNRGKQYVENPQWTKQMQEGTMVHNWVEEFIKNKLSANPIAKASIYNTLTPTQKGLFDDVTKDIDTLINSLMKEFPDSKFMTEVKLYDPEYIYIDENGKKHKGVAGSIDLLIIHPDGTASIYDWKTRNNKDDFTIFKFAQYGIQVSIYKQMLMKGNAEMGIPKVKGIMRSRLVPLNITRDIKGDITKIKYAGEVPVAAEYGENEKMNARIESLYGRFYKLLKAKAPKDAIQKKIYYDKLEDLKKMLITLQLKKSYNEVLEQAEDDLHGVMTTIHKEDVTADELQTSVEIVNLYIDILDYMDKTSITPEIEEQFTDIARTASDYNAVIVKKQTAIQQSNADKYGIEDLLKTQRGIGWVGKTFNSISEINNPMIAYLHEMVKDSLVKTEQESNEFRKKIKEETSKLSKWASANGLSIEGAYNLLINKEKGKLINKLSPDYWDAKQLAIKTSDVEWLKENLELDKERADAEMALFIENIRKTSYRKNPIKNKQVQDEKIASFRALVYNLGKSHFSTLKKDKEAKWYSKEYNNLLKPNNKALLDYYNFYTESTSDFAHKLPSFGYKGNFIPNVNKSIVESLFKVGAEEGSNLMSSVKRLIAVDNISKQDLGMVDVNTGTQGGQIPMYFINSIEPVNKSFDLGRVLQMFGEMAYNYENMSAIETNALQTLSLLKSKQAYDISSITGKKILITGTSNFKRSEEANKNWVEMYETFLEYYIYGVKTVGANKFTEILDQLNGFTATTLLGLSVFPAIAAATANISNTAIQAARNDFFSGSQWSKSIWMLSGGSATNSDTRHVMYGFLELFQPRIDNRQMAKDRNLSSSIAVKALSSDHLFVGLRSPDEFNQAAVFGAMIQNYTFNEEGRLVKIKDLFPKPKGYYDLPQGGEGRKKIDSEIEEKIKNTKSLLDLGKIVDGKFTIEGHEDLTKLSDKAILDFRQLVRQVNKNIIGNVDPNDISGYRTIAYFRSLMLFRNWMPRAISERYGSLKYNRELQQHSWGRYSTFFDLVKTNSNNFWVSVLTKNKEQVDNMRWSLLIGTERAAKIAWIKAQKEDDDLLEDMTEEQFIELYKSNIKASYRGLTLTFAVLMIMWGAGKYFDDDDKLTHGEKFWKKVVSRTYSELAMFANPIEAIRILKSPSAALSPLVSASKVIIHGLKQSGGFITGNEEMMKEATPLKYTLQLVPVVSGIIRTGTNVNETIQEIIEK